MKFDEVNKVIIDSMSITEAIAFVKFLKSEIARHEMDIENTKELIYTVIFKFKLADMLED